MIFNDLTFGQGNTIWGGNTAGSATSGADNGPWSEQIPITGPDALQGAINGGPAIENFENSPGAWYENLPSFPTWLVDAVAGVGDALTFRLTSKIRSRMGTSSVVNQCSGWYAGGALSPLLVGGSRLAYAGLAKAIPLGVEATEEGARAAFAARAGLKRAFNLGLKPLREPSFEDLVAQKNGDWGRIISGAGRTNTPLKVGVPGITAAGVVTALTGRPGSCR
jgi:hypothetical protein